ncbi:MAG: hypothetical protein OWT28_05405 [Firmicutes bacterium]|nr:hypothetical protein [Bacillota bacterium]
MEWISDYGLTPWMIGFLAMFVVFFLLAAAFAARPVAGELA